MPDRNTPESPQGNDDTTRYELKRRDVTHERLDGEVIAVNLLTGRYYSMSGTAADLFTAISSTGTQQAALSLLEQAYDLPPEATEQVQAFLDRCLEAELFEIKAETAAPAAEPLITLPDDHQRGTWQPPQLEEYEDLQDLILVDPVHDTSALGWPHVEEDHAEEDDRATEAR